MLGSRDGLVTIGFVIVVDGSIGLPEWARVGSTIADYKMGSSNVGCKRTREGPIVSSGTITSTTGSSTLQVVVGSSTPAMTAGSSNSQVEVGNL